MDRISDSGSDDWGSTPHGRTKKTDGSNRRPFFCCGKEHRVQARSATITSFHKTFSNKFECFSLSLHYLFIK